MKTCLTFLLATAALAAAQTTQNIRPVQHTNGRVVTPNFWTANSNAINAVVASGGGATTNAAMLTTGTLPDARLSTNVAIISNLGSLATLDFSEVTQRGFVPISKGDGTAMLSDCPLPASTLFDRYDLSAWQVALYYDSDAGGWWIEEPANFTTALGLPSWATTTNPATAKGDIGLSGFQSPSGWAQLLDGGGQVIVDTEDVVNVYAEIAFQGPMAGFARTNTRGHLGFSHNLTGLWTATNEQTARNGIGLGASWLTNSDAPMSKWKTVDAVFYGPGGDTVSLTAAENMIVRISAYSTNSAASYNVELPTNSADGHQLWFRMSEPYLNTARVLIRSHSSQGGAALATIGPNDEPMLFRWGTGEGWKLMVPGSLQMQLPSVVNTNTGMIYRATNQVRFRDSTNGERILLNNADNLGNLTSYVTARTNIFSTGGVPSGGAALGTPILADGATGSAFGGSTFRLGATVLLGGTNTLEQINGTNAQSLHVYNTSMTATNYERGFMRWTSNVLRIGMEQVGGSGRNVEIWRNGLAVLTFDNNLWGQMPYGLIASQFIQTGASSGISWSGRAQMFSPTTNNVRLTDAAATGFGMLQFGGVSNSFPALKRSATELQARLADDSGFTVLDAQLRSQGTAPTTSTNAGTPGDLRYDTNFFYVCVATNTWRRVALTNW